MRRGIPPPGAPNGTGCPLGVLTPIVRVTGAGGAEPPIATSAPGTGRPLPASITRPRIKPVPVVVIGVMGVAEIGAPGATAVATRTS